MKYSFDVEQKRLEISDGLSQRRQTKTMPTGNEIMTSSSTTNLASNGVQDKAVDLHLNVTGDGGSQGQTDSLGSRSDNSGRTAVWTRAASKPRMEVVCVIDHIHPVKLADRRRAFEEVKYACSVMGSVNVQHIQVSGLFCTGCAAASVTRLGDLLHFGQLF